VFGCGQGGSGSSSDPADAPSAPAPTFDVVLEVFDEDGAAVGDAFVASGAEGVEMAASAGGDGRIALVGLDQPRLVVVDAPGCLAEPVVVGRENATARIAVRLLADQGALGERRIVMNFAGDVMMGRRYLDPTLDVTAVVRTGDGGASARAVVAPIVPLFSAAHVRSLNLESVVGTLPASAAYPRKRFLLQSAPEIIEALKALRANVVTLGNNHTRDWLEPGLAATLAHLDAAGIPRVGAGTDPTSAAVPLVVDVAGYRIGCASYTSVNGDFVNDSLPDAAAPTPADLDGKEAWQYELRAFGFAGASVTIPTALRRIGAMWRLFEAVEPTVATEAELAQLWTALSAVYPELQDWVARRGHGGANPHSHARVIADVAAMRASGAEIVVVQLHSGFQFLDVKSEFVESAAHGAIDAGADLVICHHPHVLQGLEWYKGRLIAYSLGNFIFDQDFLATFDSAVLRVVFEETSLVEARVLPTALDLYRPVPVVGSAARGIIRMLHERSLEPARSERIDGVVRKVLRAPVPDAEAPQFVFERGTARLVRGPAASRQLVVTLEPSVLIELDSPALTRTRAPGGAALPGVDLGRDLLRWGDFEDLAADGQGRGGIHWSTNDSYKRIDIPSDAPEGVRALRLQRHASNRSRVLVRTLARVPFLRHRVYRELVGGGVDPADGPPSYSLVCRARLTGQGQPLVRFDVYDFDDTNPTSDPDSSLLRSRSLALDIENDGAWHDVVFDVPAAIFVGAGDLEPNATMIYLGLEPPTEGTTVLLIDELRFVEWREADALPDSFGGYDLVRSRDATTAIRRTLERIGG